MAEFRSLITEKVSRLQFHRDNLQVYLERNESRLQVDLLIHDRLKKIVTELGELLEDIGKEFRDENKPT